MSKPFAAITATMVLVSACASTPRPSNAEISDACLMLKENRSWYKALRESSRDWGAPIGLQLAIMNQESGFDGKARPEREGGFLFFPGKRPSTAYGYAQALTSTWDTYKRDTGNGGADRHSFRDAADFIGWYVNETGERTGVGQYDYRAHYLAYHEGQGGYMKGSWKKKRWLIDTANRVSAQATRYENQVLNCRGLKAKFLGIF
jgi:hypothetical protein